MLTQSITEADENVISFAGIWSCMKVLDKLKFSPEDRASKLLLFLLGGNMNS